MSPGSTRLDAILGHVAAMDSAIAMLQDTAGIQKRHPHRFAFGSRRSPVMSLNGAVACSQPLATGFMPATRRPRLCSVWISSVATRVLPIPVSVAVVAADLTNPLCPVPVPGQYICGPVNYSIGDLPLGNYNFTFALPSGCCITQKAFLMITFPAKGTCTTLPGTLLPRLIATDGCVGCVSYNVYPGGFDELCGASHFPGNPNMYVDAACCDIVPAMRGTWGRVKTLYR